MEMVDYRSLIQQCARTDQYMLHPKALRRLSEFLTSVSTDEQTAFRLIRDLFALLKKESLANRFVDEEKMNDAIQKHMNFIRGPTEKDGVPPVQVVQLGNIPVVTVDDVSGDLRVRRALDVNSGDRLHALRERYLLARRRCLRSGIYRADMKHSLVDGHTIPLVPSTALEGLTPHVQIAVLGMLAVSNGVVLLEDLFKQITLRPQLGVELSGNAYAGAGFLVVAVGHWCSGSLLVSRIELPPAEKRDNTLSEAGPASDMFGLAPPDLVSAIRAEKTALRSVIVFLSHVFLDRAATVEHLGYFFRRMQERSEGELSDTTFVIIGNFSSIPLAYGDASHLPEVLEGTDQLHGLLDRLASCVVTHSPTAAQHSHFILVPGPHDLSVLQGFIPQHPIAAHFTKELKAKLKKVTLAPNPCRLRFHTHEVIISRRDFLRAFQESERQFVWTQGAQGDTSTSRDIASPADEKSKDSASLTTFERIAKTVIDEAHIAPDGNDGRVLWRQDNALRMPVLPHTLLLCDSTEQWECFYKGVRVVNPGSFAVNTTFLWYTPADGECSLSSLE